MTTNETNQPSLSQQRNQKLGIFALIVVLIALAYGSYWYLYASKYVSTDNAYTNAEIASVTPAVGGIVQNVLVTDTQAVKAGDLLVEIDPVDAELAVASATAALERAIREVKNAQANDQTLKAQISAREADLARAEAGLVVAQADFERADVEYQRRQALIDSGSVSGDELTQSLNAFKATKARLNSASAANQQAIANLEAARLAKAANYIWIDDSSIEQNPSVQAAQARLEQAKVNLSRTELRAPFDGVIARRNVQVGQQVQPGMPLMMLVPVNDIYVDANFKEVELSKVKPGQQVEIIADLYGDEVTYHGQVSGFSAGSGSAFAAIPAQNATGNWIKVVQRLPVRIQLDSNELVQHPLKVGLSMQVSIDVTSGGAE